MSPALGKNSAHSAIMEGASLQTFSSKSPPRDATAFLNAEMRSSLSSRMRMVLRGFISAGNFDPWTVFLACGAELFDRETELLVGGGVADRFEADIAPRDRLALETPIERHEWIDEQR